MKKTLDDFIKSLKREIGFRKRVYPNWVAAGRMDQEKATHEIECMEQLLEKLEKEKQERQPSFL